MDYPALGSAKYMIQECIKLNDTVSVLSSNVAIMLYIACNATSETKKLKQSRNNNRHVNSASFWCYYITLHIHYTVHYTGVIWSGLKYNRCDKKTAGRRRKEGKELEKGILVMCCLTSQFSMVTAGSSGYPRGLQREHVDAISSKVSSRLYFRKQLKQSDGGP